MIRTLALLIIQPIAGWVYYLQDFTGWVSKQKNPILRTLGSITILVFAYPLAGALMLVWIIAKALSPQSDVIDNQEDQE